MAQGTDYFKLTIQNYLDARAREDELFAPRYANPKKNIDDCCTFIINQVRQSGCNGFADEEIYSMALHYYDEEDIDIGKPVSCASKLFLISYPLPFLVQVHRNLLVFNQINHSRI